MTNNRTEDWSDWSNSFLFYMISLHSTRQFTMEQLTQRQSDTAVTNAPSRHSYTGSFQYSFIRTSYRYQLPWAMNFTFHLSVGGCELLQCRWHFKNLVKSFRWSAVGKLKFFTKPQSSGKVSDTLPFTIDHSTQLQITKLWDGSFSFPLHSSRYYVHRHGQTLCRWGLLTTQTKRLPNWSHLKLWRDISHSPIPKPSSRNSFPRFQSVILQSKISV